MLRLLAQRSSEFSWWLPLDAVSLVGGNRIVAVESIGLQPILDFEVPGSHTYIAAGAVHHNSGKTIAGGAETVYHLTGLYPEWWEGARFETPIEATAAGDTAKNARDILQTLLVGPPGNAERQGTGLIPGDSILRATPKHGIADAIETVFVRHVTGGSSTLQFKSYDQGREAFQGTSRQWIWLDEEAPLDIYAECLMRLLTVQGLLILTMTPLRGLTPLMLEFLPELAPKPKDAP